MEHGKEINEKIPYVHERIQRIRETLGISRKDMAEQLRMEYIRLHQLEKYGTGSWPVVINILIYFYEKKKVNPLWIIVKNNEKIPQYVTQQTSSDILNLITDPTVLQKIATEMGKQGLITPQTNPGE